MIISKPEANYMHNDPQYIVALQDIGSHLYFLRKVRKETLQTVADAVNISPRLLSRIESGQRNITLVELARLAKHYQAALNIFLHKLDYPL